MEVESLLLKLSYGIDEQTYQQSIKKIKTLQDLTNQLTNKNLKAKITTSINGNNNSIINAEKQKEEKKNKLLKDLLKPLASVGDGIKRIITPIINTAKTLFKLTGIMGGMSALFGAIKQNNTTAGVLDELQWQQSKSKTAFRYMNVAAQSNLVNEGGVASEIQEIMKQQRQFKTTGTASDSNLQAMLSQFGVSLGDSIDDILNTLDKRRKVMGDTQYFTLMEQIGKGNIARAQIENQKYGEVPQLYTMGRAEKTAHLTRSYNKFTASVKDDVFKLMEHAIPMIEKLFDILAKSLKLITPLLETAIDGLNFVFEKILGLFNNFSFDKVLNSVSDKASSVKNWFAEKFNLTQKPEVNNTTTNTTNNYNVNNPSFTKQLISKVQNHTQNTTLSNLDMSFN